MIASLRVTFQKKFHVVRTVLLFQSLSRVRKDVYDTYDAQIQADHVANVNFKAYDVELLRVAYFALGQKNRLTGFRAKLIMVHGQLYKKYKGFLKWRKEQQDTFYG